MGGLKYIMRGKQQTGFLLLSFILTVIAGICGYFIALHRADTITTAINDTELGKLGIIAQYLRETEPDRSEEMLADLAARIVMPPNESDIAAGEELVVKYGYSKRMDARFSSYYPYIIKQHSELFIGAILLVSLLITSAGILMFQSVHRNMADIALYAGRILDSGETVKKNPFRGGAGLLHSAVTMLGVRFSRLFDTLGKEKYYLKAFISDVSHQMKTPLTVLRMNNELMQSGRDMSVNDRDDFLAQSELQLGRLEWLVSGQLRLAKLEADVVDFNFTNSSLFDTAETALEYFQKIADFKNITLINSVPADIILPHDPEWMTEALSNIIKNAVENTPSGGRIEISADETPMTIGLYISDSGKGIAPEVLPHIFERFYTSGAGVSISNIGIGLSLSKSILEKHSAQVCARSEPGRGTTIEAIFLKETQSKKLSDHNPEKTVQKQLLLNGQA